MPCGEAVATRVLGCGPVSQHVDVRLQRKGQTKEREHVAVRFNGRPGYSPSPSSIGNDSPTDLRSPTESRPPRTLSLNTLVKPSRGSVFCAQFLSLLLLLRVLFLFRVCLPGLFCVVADGR